MCSKLSKVYEDRYFFVTFDIKRCQMVQNVKPQRLYHAQGEAPLFKSKGLALQGFDLERAR